MIPIIPSSLHLLPVSCRINNGDNMTLPNWKKSRLVRVSRLLADLHRAPPKHGSSLLLHTGFPTSLLDLFLKNRDRFNKGAAGSSPSDPPPPRREYQELVIAVPPPPSSLSSIMTVDHHHDHGSSGGNKILFLGLFKVFVILGFALSAAQFAWAMAAAAFSLLSLELLGKYSRAGQYSGGDCNSEPRRKKQGIVTSNYGIDDRIRGLAEISTPVKGSADSLPASDKKITRTDDTTVTDHQRREPRSKPNLIKKLMMKNKARHGKKREQINPAVMAAEDHEDIIISQGSGKAQVVEDDKEISKGRSEIVLVDGNRNQQTTTGKSCYVNHQYSILMVMVIVLSGLIVGRIPALLVTVSWCLILRYVD